MTSAAARTAADVPAGTVDAARFRQILGHFCTGVTIITGLDGTGLDGDRPVGFACQSFAALSLDPPLVLFCPSRASRTWPVIARSGRFCANVLADSQRPVSAVFGRSGADKFQDLPWTPAPTGSPIVDGALTWIDCVVETAHEAGDHHIVIGRVQALGEASDQRPLLFYRGAYATLEQPEPSDLDALLSWPCDEWI